MAYTTIISTAALQAHLGEEEWAVADCRFSLQDPQQGRRAYHQAHIPTAFYVDLDQDLSGKIIPGKTGRHPLPEPEAFAETLSRWGIDEQVQVVAYDDRGGAIAARLWWMLRWLGHEKAAVLDGGWGQWVKENRPVESEEVARKPRTFRPQPDHSRLVNADFVARVLANPRYRLVDARDAVRYRGEDEPIDPEAGHIPGAVSRPYVENLNEEGKFRSGDELRDRFQALFDGHEPDELIMYCGSGVTSVHNILAALIAGYDEPRLYPGSWSEWITDPDRPRADSRPSSQTEKGSRRCH